MTFDQFSQYLSWAIYLIIFGVVALNAIRHPTRVNIDIALLFAVPALVLSISLATSLGLMQSGTFSIAVTTSLLVAWGYMLFRLVDDFSTVPTWLAIAAALGFAIFVLSDFVFPVRPSWLTAMQIVYAIALFIFSAVAFYRQSRFSSGVTRRRMRAVALGSTSLSALFLLVEVLIFFPGTIQSLRWLIDLTELASGVTYFLGFATPTVLRRAWQEPELRAFLGRAASLPRLPDTESIVQELERGAAASVGAPGASIGLWDRETQRLRYKLGDTYFDSDPNVALSGRAFLTQKPLFSGNAARDNPATADLARSTGTVALLAAPITAGDRRLGLLVVHSTRAPIFAEEDLEVVSLLADQAAVILESRALIDEAARVKAREQVTRMKEDFLSAAAHDLKTPLTTLVMQADLLERRALRSPGTPIDVTGLQKLKKEAYRLKDLVLELLDAARAEQGRLVGEFEKTDLVAIAKDVCGRHSTHRHPCVVEAHGDPTGLYDTNRIAQLVENLVENAVKYSPEGGPVTIRLWQEQTRQPSPADIGEGNLKSQTDPTATVWNHLTVTDCGIGIPKEDLNNVFDRFHRGTNVDDRHFAGMGLGLFICQGIVEQHGGRIWVQSPAQPAPFPALDGSSQDQHFGSNSYSPESLHSSLNGASAEANERAADYIGIGGDGNPWRANPGTTFHVALPAVPPPVAPEPAGVGASGGQPEPQKAV